MSPETMKLRDIKKCDECGKGVLHTGVPLFWRVRVERFGIDMREVRQLHGLEMMLGSPSLADVFSPERDAVRPVMDAVELTLCEECMSGRGLGLAALVERTARASGEDDTSNPAPIDVNCVKSGPS